jgi:hypothetical protein
VGTAGSLVSCANIGPGRSASKAVAAKARIIRIISNRLDMQDRGLLKLHRRHFECRFGCRCRRSLCANGERSLREGTRGVQRDCGGDSQEWLQCGNKRSGRNSGVQRRITPLHEMVHEQFASQTVELGVHLSGCKDHLKIWLDCVRAKF